MISNGNATITVSDLDAAIRFYTEQLGLQRLKLGKLARGMPCRSVSRRTP